MSTADGTPPDEFERTPLWVSHHRADQVDHCVRVGRLHVCRRCLVLYPVVVVTAVVVATVDPVASPLVGLGVVVALIPFLVDWVTEHLGFTAYSAPRSALVSVIGALGLGSALGVHVHHPFEPLVTVPVAVVAAAAALVAVLGRWSRPDVDQWGDGGAADFETRESARIQRLEALLGVIEDGDG